MKRILLAVGTCATALLVAVNAAAQSQDYPNRPIRIVVPQAPGSGPDIVARAIGQKITESMGQQVIVENRAGANGIIGMEAVAKSKPDGYTLVHAVPSALTMNPYVYKKLPYDTFKDFVPVTQTADNPFGLLVNPGLPVRTVKELVALGRARPSQLDYASFGIGNQTHLAGELFALATNLKLTHVPYKGQTPAVTDLIGGQIALLFTPLPGAAQHIDSGKLRLLATCGEARDTIFTNAPTMRESGFPTVIITGWLGLLAPAGTPKEIVNHLQSDVAKHLQTAEMKDTFTRNGTKPVGSTPEQFERFIKSEAQKWSSVIKQAGLEFTQ